LANPIGAVIAGIVAVFALLNKAIQSNDELATGWKGVMTGIGIVLDNVFNAIGTGIKIVIDFASSIDGNSILGKALGFLNTTLSTIIKGWQFLFDFLPAVGQILKGDFSGAINTAGQAVENFKNNQFFRFYVTKNVKPSKESIKTENI
jgi:hypothetical protein